MNTYDQAPTNPHHGGKIWDDGPRPEKCSRSGSCGYFEAVSEADVPARDLSAIIRDLHWMARRYADGRSSYAPSLFNDHVRSLLAMGYALGPVLFARDGMGRLYDKLTGDQVKYAEEDMPRGHAQVVEESEQRANEILYRLAAVEKERDELRERQTAFQRAYAEILALAPLGSDPIRQSAIYDCMEILSRLSQNSSANGGSDAC